MKMTADESAAIALAFVALRASIAARPRRPARMNRWSRAAHGFDAFDPARTERDGATAWIKAARFEALGRDV